MKPAAQKKTVVVVPAEKLFRALADRTRLRILFLLLKGELCVCHIVDTLRVPQPTASRHLAYLRRCGLVLCRREGQWCYYRLAPVRSRFHQQLMDCLQTCCRGASLGDEVQKSPGRGCCE